MRSRLASRRSKLRHRDIALSARTSRSDEGAAKKSWDASGRGPHYRASPLKLKPSGESAQARLAKKRKPLIPMLRQIWRVTPSPNPPYGLMRLKMGKISEGLPRHPSFKVSART